MLQVSAVTISDGLLVGIEPRIAESEFVGSVGFRWVSGLFVGILQ